MNKEKYVMANLLSKKQLIRSGFPYGNYSFIEQPGEYEAVLDNKCWGHNNILLFFTLTNEEKKIITAVWRNSSYLGLRNTPIGSRVLLLFKRSSTGNVYLKDAEVIEYERDFYGKE